MAACFLNGLPGSIIAAGSVEAGGGVGACLHTSYLEGDRLVGADLLAERLPFLGVLHALVDAALCRTDRQRRDGDPALVEDAQEVGVAAAAFTEQVLRRHPHVVEAQRVGVGCIPAHLVVRGFRGVSRGGNRHQDRRDLLAAMPIPRVASLLPPGTPIPRVVPLPFGREVPPSLLPPG